MTDQISDERLAELIASYEAQSEAVGVEYNGHELEITNALTELADRRAQPSAVSVDGVSNPRPYAGVVFPDEWDADTGTPDIIAIAQAIQVWTMLNPPYTFTVRQIGDAFNLDDAQVRQAVEAHYWMFLDGPDDDPTKQIVEHEGE